MPVWWNVWSSSPLRLTVQSTPPLHQRVVRRLASTFIFVKACACFAAQHLLVAQPEQNSWDVIALPIGLLECVGDIDRDIHAYFIDQSQRTHRHSPFHERTIDSLCVHAALK